MYTPTFNKVNDLGKTIEYIQSIQFATMFSAVDGLKATYIPFVVEKQNKEVTLFSHLAKANPQWKQLHGEKVLISFLGPHAYISPTNYNKNDSVPTWDYIAVQCHGIVELIHNKNEVIEILLKQAAFNEPEYLEQWKTISQPYKDRLFKALVAFKVEVTDWFAKEKLSQDKSEGERKRIREWLNDQNSPNLSELL